LRPNSAAIGASTEGINLGSNTLPVYNDQPQLLFSEILYDDTLSASGEFLEILNPGTEPVDLQGYTIANAVDFSFPAGAVISPGEYIVIAKDASNFAGVPYQVFAWDGGKLADEGEAIHLFDASGLLVDFVRYDNHAPWPERADLQGKSLELVSQNLDNHFASSWQPSKDINGTPGAAPAINVGTFSPVAQAQITVFPNPVAGQMTVALKNTDAERWRVTMTDALGKTVLEQFYGGDRAVLNLQGVAAGAYFVSVFNAAGNLLGFEKVIVR
jgi:hypothetical protein